MQVTCVTSKINSGFITTSSTTNITLPDIVSTTASIISATTTNTVAVTSVSNVASIIPISTTSSTTASLSAVVCHYNGRCQNLKCPYKHPPVSLFVIN